VVPALLYILTRRMLWARRTAVPFAPIQDLEIVVLRYELAILRREVARPELSDAERVLFGRGFADAAAPALVGLLVTPETRALATVYPQCRRK